MWFMDATESRKVTLHLKKFTVPDAEVSFALMRKLQVIWEEECTGRG